MKKTSTSKKSDKKGNNINLSDDPKVTAEMFARDVIRKGLKPVPRKSQITLRIDQDVIEFFKSKGRGYQTLINQILRAYMEAHKTD
jgi:uncharacterized protein (DUF4415 family)